MAIKAKDQITLVDLTDGYSVTLSSESYTFKGDTDKVLGTQSITTEIQALRGGDVVRCSVNVDKITVPLGLTIKSDNASPKPTLTITADSNLNRNGQILIPVSVGDVVINKAFSYAIAFKGDKGDQGIQGDKGDKGDEGNGIQSVTITYQISNNGTTAPTGTWYPTVQKTSKAYPYLWTRTETVYSNGKKTVSYSVSSSIDSVGQDIEDAKKTATNYINFDTTGLKVGDMTKGTLGNHVLIDSDSVDIKNGNSTLASFSANTIELGKNNPKSTISLCNNMGEITYKTSEVDQKECLQISGGNLELVGLNGIQLYGFATRTYNGKPILIRNLIGNDKLKGSVKIASTPVDDTDPNIPRGEIEVATFVRMSGGTLDLTGKHQISLMTDKEVLVRAENINLSGYVNIPEYHLKVGEVDMTIKQETIRKFIALGMK